VNVDPDDLSRREVYELMTGAIVPRPIAWVSTRASGGEANLAPFSFFSGVTSNPMTVSVAIAGRRGALKDTIANILETEEFVVNVVEEAAAERMVASSHDFPPEVSEFEACGVEEEPSETIGASRVRGAPVALECVLEHVLEVGHTPDHLVLGRVRRVHVRDDLLGADGRIDPSRWTALGRLGRQLYVPVRETIEIERPR
jgi:flavin reductase (DIM6/NTAB) family NADH-FMN oxidoreductase RutF